MAQIKGNLEVTVTLNKASCYFMRTGKCSLGTVSDYYITASVKTAQNELLYCPRLRRIMHGREQERAVTVVPCSCGHAEVTAGRQRVCIAGQLRLPLRVQVKELSGKPCSVCGSQMTFEARTGGPRIVTVPALIDVPEENEK
jgi:hypothetical protein